MLPFIWYHISFNSTSSFLITPQASLFSPFSFTFAFAFISSVSLAFLFNKKANKQQYPLPPGPKPWPVVGNLPRMLRNKPTFRWMHKLMQEMNTEIACIRLGSVHVIPVSCPEISREFLRKHDAVFASRPLTMCTDEMTKGYLTTALAPLGDQRKKMKKVLATEVLSLARLRWLSGKRAEEADNLVRYVYNQSQNSDNGGVVDVRLTAQQYPGNVIRKLMFNRRYFGEGREDGGPGFEEEEHVGSIFTLLAHMFAFCISDYMPCLRGLDLDGHEKVVKKANAIVGKYQDPIVDERIRQYWREHGSTKKEPQDLLDVMVMLKDADGYPLLSPNEIKAQITELNLAMVDNASNAFEWALAEMLNQPKILDKAVEELDRVVGKERLVQESDFPQLNYVKACVREAFRLHPYAPFNAPHVCVSDAIVANYFIPKGSHVLLSRRALGRNPKIWDEPHKFKPERHLSTNGSDVTLAEPDLRFISFSTGRRGCSGIALGTSVTVMLFARLLHSFSWSLPPNEPNIDLREEERSLFLAKPLHAIAKPRLPANVYPLNAKSSH